MEKLEQLEKALQTHDWFYQFSDDHRYWKKGLEQADNIMYLMLDLERAGMKAEADALYQKYCPKDPKD